MIKVGILSLQGDVSEHVCMTKKAMEDLKVRGSIIEVKEKAGIRDINALIIPGGESTTIGKLLEKSGIDREIKKLAKRGVPIMGTCTGMILLGRVGGDVSGDVNSLGLMDITVRRNAFGHQGESFEVDLGIPKLGKKSYHGVFIRAPLIEEVGDDVEILARYGGGIVMARQDRLIAVAFHPELSGDLRVHKYFLGLIET
jgi:5'-phosphate synthase pdxT subunit